MQPAPICTYAHLHARTYTQTHTHRHTQAPHGTRNPHLALPIGLDNQRPQAQQLLRHQHLLHFQLAHRVLGCRRVRASSGRPCRSFELHCREHHSNLGDQGSHVLRHLSRKRHGGINPAARLSQLLLHGRKLVVGVRLALDRLPELAHQHLISGLLRNIHACHRACMRVRL